jgi:hypothetical protein
MQLVMLDLETTQQVSWDFSIFLRTLLLCLLLFRKNIRSLPFFTAYLLVNLSKGLVLNFVYKTWGFDAPISHDLAWETEAVVVCARALAVMELCRLVFIGYRGIWSLAWRVLLTCAAFVFLYSSLVSEHSWTAAILGASRALELTIATVLVALFVFLRYYQVVPEPTIRSLALGFCVYSCIAVLNDTILLRWLARYAPVWNALGVFAYLACLLFWIWALRKSFPLPVLNPMLLPSSVYRQISPEINSRLRALNNQLSQFWGIEEVPRP